MIELLTDYRVCMLMLMHLFREQLDQIDPFQKTMYNLHTRLNAHEVVLGWYVWRGPPR